MSDAETQEIGRNFSKELKSGDIVLLYGDLGYGKTTFVKGIAKGLGISSRIISPTFTIIRIHSNMHHIDLYRIENENQLTEIGMKEILSDESSIKLIEWPEKLKELPQHYIEVKITLNKDDTRTIKINKHG